MAPKKRGRKHDHWAEKARVFTWYKEVKRRCEWTDYVLNNQFVWTEYGQKEKRKLELGSSDSTAAPRPKSFDWMRKIGRKPKGRDKRWRDMDEIVAAVDQHPLFSRTKSLYTAKFWELLQLQAIAPSSVQLEIDRLLANANLISIDYDEIETLLFLTRKYSHAAVLDRCLRLSLRTMDDLSAIELIWYLYLLAESNKTIQMVIEKIADKKLESFFAGYFPAPEALNYSTNSINTLLQTRLDMTERDLDGYGFLGVITMRLIIPNQLLHSISESNLFHPIEIEAHSAINHINGI